MQHHEDVSHRQFLDECSCLRRSKAQDLRHRRDLRLRLCQDDQLGERGGARESASIQKCL